MQKKTFNNKLNIAKQYFTNKIYSYIINRRLKSTNFDFNTHYNNGILKLDGLSIFCRKEDFSAIAETCIVNDYQKITETKIREGDIVFDIGSHIGSFAIMAAKLGAVVYAFEPSKKNYDFLVKNIKLNNLEKSIVPFNIGIYNIDGELGINTEMSNTGGYSVTEDFNEKITVKKLSTVMSENNIKKIDLIKIDVEGSEYEIFTSDFNTLPIDKIVGEYHLDWKRPKLGYSLIKKLLPTFKVGKYIPYYFYAIKK